MVLRTVCTHARYVSSHLSPGIVLMHIPHQNRSVELPSFTASIVIPRKMPVAKRSISLIRGGGLGRDGCRSLLFYRKCQRPRTLSHCPPVMLPESPLHTLYFFALLYVDNPLFSAVRVVQPGPTQQQCQCVCQRQELREQRRRRWQQQQQQQ